MYFRCTETLVQMADAAEHFGVCYDRAYFRNIPPRAQIMGFQMHDIVGQRVFLFAIVFPLATDENDGKSVLRKGADDLVDPARYPAGNKGESSFQQESDIGMLGAWKIHDAPYAASRPERTRARTVQSLMMSCMIGDGWYADRRSSKFRAVPYCLR